jgi:hypothetical protein
VRLAAWAILLLSCLSASAQEQFDHGVPIADPARPTVTNPAHIPPVGYVQFEQGAFVGAGTSDVDTQFSMQQSTKLALTHHVMVQVESQPWVHTQSHGFGQDDTGDLLAGLQVVLSDLKEGHDVRPTVAVAYTRRVRSGTSPDLDVAGLSQGGALLASGNLFGLHYDTNFLFNQVSGGVQFGQTLAVSGDVSKNWSLSGEIWHFTQPDTGGDAVGTLWNGAYSVRPYLILDAGFNRGLTSTSAHWYGFVGFTYLLPHRVWRGRKPG